MEAHTGEPKRQPPLLSIIIPAYNEAERLPDNLRQLRTFLDRCPFGSEVIVVDNGSDDATAELVRQACAVWPTLRLVQTSGRGKGLAVRLGLLAAEGQYSFYCDADFSMPIPEIAKFLPPQLVGAELAIGTREGPAALRVGEPIRRHLMGRAYNFLVRRLALPGIQDSQCGFKCLRADIGRRLASVLTIDGWGFDVELLVVARRWGYHIVEVPIHWHYSPSSHIHPLLDSWRMTNDLLAVRRNVRAGRYDRQCEASALPKTGSLVTETTVTALGESQAGRLG